MTDLKCNVKSCTHNADNYCSLENIKVDGCNARNCTETCCDSFLACRECSTNMADSPNMRLNINCSAKNCMYNLNSSCTAEHVDISGIRATEAKETVCATFQERN